MGELTKSGKFEPGKSGNALGRPKGSKNKITVLKLMAEEAVRGDNSSDMQEVCRLIVESAKDGDIACRKMVWDAVMSKGSMDVAAAKEKVSIHIGAFEAPKPEEKPIEGEVIIESTSGDENGST